MGIVLSGFNSKFFLMEIAQPDAGVAEIDDAGDEPFPQGPGLLR